MVDVTITHLFRKKAKWVPMTPENSLMLKRWYGIVWDKNASPISPRQVLITRQEDLEELNIPFSWLRENIIVKWFSKEEFLPWGLLTIWEVKIRLTFYCEPCQRIADVIPSIPAVFHKRWILGVIIEWGEIAVGNEAIIKLNAYHQMSENPTERFLGFVCLVPKGKVVTYKTVAKAMWVAEGFIRAMPGYIKRVLGTDIPVWRIVDVEGNIIDKHISEQQKLLEAEWIEVINWGIDLHTYGREEQQLFLQ